MLDRTAQAVYYAPGHAHKGRLIALNLRADFPDLSALRAGLSKNRPIVPDPIGLDNPRETTGQVATLNCGENLIPLIGKLSRFNGRSNPWHGVEWNAMSNRIAQRLQI